MYCPQLRRSEVERGFTLLPRSPPIKYDLERKSIFQLPAPSISQTASFLMPSSETTVVNKKASQRRLRLWMFFCLTALIFSPIASILIGLNFHARDFYDNDKESRVVYSGRTIVLEVVLIAADPKQGTLTLDWTMMGEANSLCSRTTPTPTNCSNINLFFDNNLLRTDQGSGDIMSSNRPSSPIFVFNATAFAITDIIANTPTFRTQLALFSPSNVPSSLIYYPFDRYTAEILVFAQDADNNNTVGVSLGRTRGIAVGFKTSAVTRPNVNIPPGVLDIIVNLERENLVKIYSIVATIAVWLVTLILLLVMITSVFFGFRQKGEVLVVPVATLFAFTALRQSMPGAPEGFGDIVDFVGLLPCLAILSVSASLTLGAFVLTDPTAEDNPLTRDVLYDAFPVLNPSKKAIN
ncbi:hypothetical protein C8J56DRAFT_1025257 [Mycena floridula]|nr:hypothetical protein C8J56DRAFT_1025257 [Mycena floridula]